MNEKILNIQDLQTYYSSYRGNVKAVDRINLKVGAGGVEAVGLVGETGCGKSTVARTILRLIPRSARIIGGEIIWKDKDLLKLTDEEIRTIRGSDISMIFQDPSTYLNPLMKVGDQIMEAIRLHQSITKKEAKVKINEILEMVRLSPSETCDQFPFQLSGGMQQRIMIAMALSCNPSLIIADEPTTNLDVTVQAQILHLFRELKEKMEISFVLITHNLGVVAEFCDRVYVMYAGKIVEQADVFTIFENPKHPYFKALLQSALSINHFKEKIIGIGGSVADLINPPSGCRFHPRCRYGKPICSEQTPPTIEIEQGSYVSCWLYG